MKLARRLVLGGIAALLLGCSDAPREPRFEDLPLPAPPGSSFPSLAVNESGLHVSWIEPGEDESRVRLAVPQDRGWAEPETIAAGADLFVNWADFPSIAFDADGTLGAQWLVRAGGPSSAYGVRFAAREANGLWSAAAIPHGEDHAGEHGFVSIVSDRPVTYDTVWLDGREMQGGGAMTLRSATWTAGRFGPSDMLDDDVCSCCQTDMAAFENQRFVVYRDHAPGEIRDISYVRFDGERWSAPAGLSGDGWQIATCPVNGPSIGSRGPELGVVWFTLAHERPRVWARRSNDFGLTFGEPLRIDDGDPVGRVDAAMLFDGSLVVVWLERDGDAAAVRVRRVVGDAPGPAYTVGLTSQGRDSGFPRVATDGEHTWIAWTETSRPPRVRLARINW